jgi:membrane protease YdiL (CAAX protease family)
MELDKPTETGSAGGPGSQDVHPKARFLSGDRWISIWKAAVLLFVMIEVAPRATSLLVLFPLNGVVHFSPLVVLLLAEPVNFGILLGICSFIARLEERSLGDYGLPGESAFGRKFWLGFLLGLAEISILVGLIAAFGGYSFGTVALEGRAIAGWGLLHLGLFLFVGFYEEFLFRGYAQFTLGGAIGFWPAAVVLSAVFGYLHLGNGGENWVGVSSVILVGLFFAFTLRRTGSLWYAIGLHASFDWGETYLFSVPNSGTFMPGHLSNSVLHGAKWLTGGSVGPEGSVFCFLTVGLQFLVVMWLFPAKKGRSLRSG